MKKNIYIKPHHEPPEYDDAGLGEIEKTLKPLLISIVERAFRRYCKAHRADPRLEEQEWLRFQKILNGML